MIPTPALGLPAAIEAAVRRVKLAARGAAERAVDSLGVSALASANVFQRDDLLGAQFELNRKLALFCNGFDEVLDQRVESEVLPRHSTQAALSETNWDALSLVDDREMEVQVSAERLGLQIAQDCEAEQRELDTFVGSMLQGLGDVPRNPLRPEVIGNAVIRSVDKVTDRAELRKVLVTELGRTMAASMAATYAAIVQGHARRGPETGVVDLAARRSRLGFQPHRLGRRHQQPAGGSGRQPRTGPGHRLRPWRPAQLALATRRRTQHRPGALRAQHRARAVRDRQRACAAAGHADWARWTPA